MLDAVDGNGHDNNSSSVFGGSRAEVVYAYSHIGKKRRYIRYESYSLKAGYNKGRFEIFLDIFIPVRFYPAVGLRRL